MSKGIPFSVLLFLTAAAIGAETYDPLEVGKEEIESETFEIRDASRARTIPIRVYLPETEKPAAVILFSHGLGGSRDNSPYLGNHWAKRGYVVVFVQHSGSDESVWKDIPARERMAAMKGAASMESFTGRMKDIPFVIDTLEKWNSGEYPALNGRMDLEHIGMSGHSFGAKTTQAVSGQEFMGKSPFVEKRIKASVMMSPSLPKMGDPAKAFGSITVPCLLMTGTQDASPIGDDKPEDRVKMFPNLAKAPAWQVVFDGAEHMDFGQRKEKEEKPKRYHTPVLALTTAFWDANLRGDTAAKEWLNGEGAKAALDGKDKWEINGSGR